MIIFSTESEPRMILTFVSSITEILAGSNTHAEFLIAASKSLFTASGIEAIMRDFPLSALKTFMIDLSGGTKKFSTSETANLRLLGPEEKHQESNSLLLLNY
jgi:hypothetical protein